MESYEAFYGLRGRPFALVPDLAAYFATASHRRAMFRNMAASLILLSLLVIVLPIVIREPVPAGRPIRR